MSGKRLEAKHKFSRRIGANLWGQAKSPVNRRNYAPGQHGQKGGKKSNYAVQLIAKQTLKMYYGGLGERQFRRYYQEASRRRGDTGEILIELLERRLDAVIYRMKFAPTIFTARQLVNHGHVLVNGKRVNIPSFQVSDGDTIELKEKSRQITPVIQAQGDATREIPAYMEVDAKAMKGTFTRTPALLDVPYAVRMEPGLVVEFYSR
jgi:small subunit ribosomal protein S4